MEWSHYIYRYHIYRYLKWGLFTIQYTNCHLSCMRHHNGQCAQNLHFHIILLYSRASHRGVEMFRPTEENRSPETKDKCPEGIFQNLPRHEIFVIVIWRLVYLAARLQQPSHICINILYICINVFGPTTRCVSVCESIDMRKGLCVFFYMMSQ